MKKKEKISTVVLILVFLAGLSLLLYPTVSDYWNSMHSTQAIMEYVEQVAALDNNDYDEMLEKAREYNQQLLDNPNRYEMSEEERETYNSLLNFPGGVMGYLEIPSIKVKLPIYHGTDESVLQVGVGHIEGSSLPVGGESVHSVLSGHRGLPSAKLFTDLDKLSEGDIFTIQILDEALTYEVDQIRIVEPQELDMLAIEEGMDYCTLVTCTPYGINTHRLLVRGHRIENLADNTVRITADAVQIDPVIVAPFIAVPLLLILLVVYTTMINHNS